MARNGSPVRAEYTYPYISPLQGLVYPAAPRTQGCALGYRIAPLRGCRITRRRQPRSALTLIEVVVSTLIVGIMAVAALNALAAATKSSNSIGNRAVAAALADELMSEIMMQPYSDPDGSPVLGHESGETTNVRSAFDDVDDYDGWVASPPQYRDGTVIPDRTNWRQRVTVNYVSPTNLTQTGSTDLGVKRIRVQIEYQNQVLADEYAFRTDTDDK